ncbi:MAG: DNA methyltransferase [Pseudomonadota bacterium]
MEQDETVHRIIRGDSRRMARLEDESVHLVVTSPPYWQLKDYGGPGQIGFHETYADYVNHLNLVWSQCLRVLHPGCRLCVNIGDQFARSTYYGRYKVIPIRTEIIRFCETVGFDYMGAVIWQKVTTTNTTGGGSVMGSYPYPRNGVLKLDYEFILLFKKPGKPPAPSPKAKSASAMTAEEWGRYFAGHWVFPGEKQKKHPAAFPEKLPQRLIRMFTFVGETVLDPFLGSGTTSVAAWDLARNSVGYEINPDFVSLARERLSGGQMDLFSRCRVAVEEEEDPAVDFSGELAALPYLFTDPVAGVGVCRADVRRTYGSRIAGDEAPREEYHRVARVPEPETVVLKDGTRLRLCGLRVPEEARDEAVAFLEKKTRSQPVYFRTDPLAPPDPGGRVPAYLYLKNRTFLNAQLLRRGLAEPDVEGDYKKKARFEKIVANRKG